MEPAPGSGRRVLVTGAHGFVGSALVRRLASHTPHWRLDTPRRSSAAGHAEGVMDIGDPASVEAWIRERPPSLVIHLAAIAAVTYAAINPRRAWDVNLGGTLNLVLALQKHAPDAHMLHISSAEVYGASLADGPRDEQGLLRPVNAYAASKAAADLLVRQAGWSGLKTCVMRPFNHLGPGQSRAFMAPSFANQIARIEAGLEPPVLKVGALDDERDFLDIEDVVAAYLCVLERWASLDMGEVFNVASGRATRIGDMLEQLISRSRANIKVEVDPRRLRQASVKRVVGDARLLRERFGWRPAIPISDTLERVLEYERETTLAARSARRDAGG